MVRLDRAPVAVWRLIWVAIVACGVESALACGTCDHCRASECAPHGHSDGGHGGLRFTPLALGSPPASPAAGTNGAIRFGVVGDTQGRQFVSQLTADMNTQALDFAIYPGDLVGTGGAGSWNAWLNDTSIANFDMYMVPGNHDLPAGGDALWQSTFHWLPDSQTVDGINGPQTGIDQMDYYFDVGNTRFISVTTDSQANGTRHPAAALPWFENVLNLPSTRAMDHVFVYTHHPITFDVYDNSGGVDGAFWQAMVDSGAPVHGIFEGHWHQYQPGRPDPYNQQLWEIIAGTGNAGFSGYPWQNKIGFTVIEVEGTEATAEFYGDADDDGRYDDLLDSFVVASAMPRTTGLVVAYDFLDGAVNVDTAHLSSPAGLRINGGYRNGAQATGGVLQLDGADDFADASGINDYDLAILRDLTIAVRANFDRLEAGDDANTLVSYTSNVAGYTNVDEIVNQPYNLRIRDDGRLEFMWEFNDRQAMTFVSDVAAPANAGEWHDYAVIRDATAGEVRFFFDGAQLGGVLTFDPLSELPTGGQQGYLRIGANWITSESGFFDGRIDSLAIWNEVTDEFDLPLVGDFNRDNRIDSLDWDILRSNQHADLSGLTLIEASLLGDLNADLMNNHADFVLFKQLFENANGVGSFASMLASVPEPGALSIGALTLCCLLLVRRQSCSAATDADRR